MVWLYSEGRRNQKTLDRIEKERTTFGKTINKMEDMQFKGINWKVVLDVLRKQKRHKMMTIKTENLGIS